MKRHLLSKRSIALILSVALICMPVNAAGTDTIVTVDAPGSVTDIEEDEDSADSSVATTASQDELDRQEIEDSKRKIEENKAKLSELQSERVAISDTLSALNELKADTLSYIEELDAKLSELGERLSELTELMDETEEAIRITEEDLLEAKASESEQYSSMKTRIKYMYENGSISSLNVLFESGSLSELLNRAEYIRQITEYDRAKLEEYKATVQEIAEKEAELNEGYETLSAMADEAEAAMSDLEALQNDKQAELAAYNERINSADAELSATDANISEIEAAMQAEENNIAAIEAEIKRREEEARQQAESSGETYETVSIGDISFIWPIPDATTVTSNFGSREQPMEGASTNHNGIDISSSTGTSVVAAASGTVVISTYSASAGNYIMINHGGGVYTVYMHMSSLSVSVDEEVSQGQQIGLSGSTGYSTGPHLHFGIRINGSYVDPLSYVSP